MPEAHHAHGTDRVTADRRNLGSALALISAYALAEVIGGVLSGSLALMADAGHMLSDALALGLSLFAFWVARRPATATRTYGYYRAEILAALANGAALVAIALLVFVEAYHRIQAPPQVRGGLMLAVAAGGLIVNLLALWILGRGHSTSLNVRGAWLHVLSDTVGSVGALVAGGLILTLGWTWADPAASILIGLLIIYSSWQLLAEVVGVLMEGAPGHIDVDAVRDAMRGVPGVTAVHDLHVWTITSGLYALSAHAEVDGSRPHRDVLQGIHDVLRERFGIDHLTIQIEP